MKSPAHFSRLQSEPHLSRQYDLLFRLQPALTNHDCCLGAAVGGSLAECRGDRLSDVDLIVYCKEGSAPEVLRVLSEIAEDKPVVFRLEGRHDACSVYEKVILEDWSSYEIHVIEPSTRMRLAAPYLEVFNRDGYLASRADDRKPIGRDTLRPLASGEDGLVWELFNCMKWLRRGDKDFTTNYLQELGKELGTRKTVTDE